MTDIQQPNSELPPPDWVNDVPARYGPNWPEERRCRYEFRHACEYRGRSVYGRPCGFPVEDAKTDCHFHCGGWKQVTRLHVLMPEAASQGVYMGESVVPNGSFVGCCLSGALFRHSDFSGADFRGADLSHAELRETNLSGTDLSNADLSGAWLWRADFAGATLDSAKLSDSQVCGARMADTTDLTGIAWWADDARPMVHRWLHVREPVFREEREAEDDYDLAFCERAYRRLKRWYHSSGDYDQASTFFIREMECKRKQLPRWSLMRAVYHVLHFASDYFENPWRVIVIGGLIILLFAFLHAGTGLVCAAGNDLQSDGHDIGGAGCTLNPLIADWAAMGRTLYFSAVTFTATGYGDYVPAEGWGQFLAAAESLTGVFLMAMFLVCLARKFGRA